MPPASRRRSQARVPRHGGGADTPELRLGGVEPRAQLAELRGELDVLRERLAAAEAQIGLRSWLRRKLGRTGAR